MKRIFPLVFLLGAWVPAWSQGPPAPSLPAAKVTLLAPITVKVKSGMAVLKGPAAGELSWDWDERFLSDTDDKRQVYVNKAARELVAVAPNGTYRFSCTAFEATKGAIKQVYYVEFEGDPMPPGPLPPVPPVPPPDTFAGKLKRAYDADKLANKVKDDELRVVLQVAANAHLVLDVAPDAGSLYALMDFAFERAVTKGDMPTVMPLLKGHIRATEPVSSKMTDALRAKFRLVFAEVTKAIESLLGPQPPPDPTPGPSPIPEPGLHVLIVYESSAVTPAQNLVISGAEVRGYVASKSGKFRAYDQNAPLINEEEWVKLGWKRERKSVPWIIVSNHPKGGFEGPLPATVQETMSLLKKWGE